MEIDARIYTLAQRQASTHASMHARMQAGSREHAIMHAGSRKHARTQVPKHARSAGPAHNCPTTAESFLRPNSPRCSHTTAPSQPSPFSDHILPDARRPSHHSRCHTPSSSTPILRHYPTTAISHHTPASFTQMPTRLKLETRHPKSASGYEYYC